MLRVKDRVGKGWYKVLLLAVASGNFTLAQLVERLDTQMRVHGSNPFSGG